MSDKGIGIDGRFVDADLWKTPSDRLVQIDPGTGKKGLVHVLLEHKARLDPETRLQIMARADAWGPSPVLLARFARRCAGSAIECFAGTRTQGIISPATVAGDVP